MFKLSVHEKVEYEREKVYLCRKEMFHLLIYINLLAELKKRLKISIFLWRKSCASR